MDSELFRLVGFGFALVVLAAVVVGAMVHFELAPRSRLGGRGAWFLAVGLGTGVLAFAFKLALIVLMLNFPRLAAVPVRDIAPPRAPASLPAKLPPRYAWAELPSRLSHAPAGAGAVWQALPAQAPAPAHNPTTPEKIALGERLFFDPALSRDRTVACASCHDIRHAGADGRPTARGIGAQTGRRNTPTVFNAAFQATLFWDGRAASLEEQAKGPLTNPIEMGMPSLRAVEQRVEQDPAYRPLFQRAFGDGGITIDRIAAAIAAYERTLITPDAPYDRFLRGDLGALSPAQLRGMALFQSLGCVNCHSGPNFSGASLFDGRAPLRIFPAVTTPYESRYRLLEDTGAATGPSGRGVWRIPSLRNVALTGPWFHNGAVTELAEAVRIMASAQLGRTGRMLVWSDQDKVLRELDGPTLGEPEVSDLVQFLHALTSDSLGTRVAGADKRVVATYHSP